MSLWESGESGKESIRSWLQKMGKKQWTVLLLLGLLLAVIALPVSNEGGKKETESFLTEEPLGEEGESLENKLEELLSQVEGVGRTRVLLMTGQEQKDAGFGERGETKVTGVLIAAQGADNSVTVQKIQQAVMALFQIEAHKIKVMKMV